MNKERIFIGNIMQNGNIIEKNVKFIQCRFDLYVKYDHVKKSNDLFIINFDDKNVLMYSTSNVIDSLYIDINSLVPYVVKNDFKSKNRVRKINKTVNM